MIKDLLPGLLRRVKPDLVMYNAGTDVHREDTLGKMALTTEGIARRDDFVLRCCAEHQVRPSFNCTRLLSPPATLPPPVFPLQPLGLVSFAMLPAFLLLSEGGGGR